VRPFCKRAQIRPRECSLGVQRALVDFGVEHSFVSAAARFAEHYGWNISPTVLRHWTLQHAQQSASTKIQALPAPRQTLITALDGSMVPIVYPAESGDGRKNKELLWREIRVAMARRQEDASARYGATLDSCLGAGLMWRQTAEQSGLIERTSVHALADGAPWIVEQCDRQFGEQATFLVDFHHVSDYLAAAAVACAGKGSCQWFEKQKQRLLENRVEEVLAELQTHFEAAPKDNEGKTPPVRQAHQYINERKNWMDYAGALRAGLPIGSGPVESAHRHIVQARVKKAGAWWRESNVQAVVQMRVLRANGGWSTYWANNAILN
jgi:Uncharacterised protein family (UPF0236)